MTSKTESVEPDEIELGAVLSALADPHRRQVVRDLVNDAEGSERSCTSFGLDLSKSTRSHHFKVLREAGLVHQVDRGNRSEVTLRRHDLDARFPGLLALIGSESDG
ncbi:helix-turn-helix transcriptional regulator [Kytococcus sedentarius]|uniref:Transcriptional regulator, ArsR family n=1 Tax=Kytococcus sedentarius (strain ATCC 14392 / DSM 20547 / JCM 11482 / CCUG 33030 / NBRC 15357 / NCTC 11040 / CCM 314 / 541) TaxID=478801 RepID=C7NFC6_KYTSD|nr:transcriptional regulator, ArsR family [Kytococcus sedentarius DSM 20547]QQB64259.1 helix-turn-helix transcriptional regulator [Kytococcus sedentarius]STX12721.1 Helix-turn-helix domain [Kytococcus sedentarius]